MRKILLSLLLCLGVFRAYSTEYDWVKADGPYGANGLSVALSENITALATTSTVYFISDDGTVTSNRKGIQEDEYINRLFSSEGKFYGTTFDNVYLYDDVAEKWESLNFTTEMGLDFESIGVFNNTLFLTTNQSGIYSSDDMGQTWDLSFESPWEYHVVYEIFENDGRIFSSYKDTLIYSDDYGLSWNKKHLGEDSFILDIVYHDGELIIFTDTDFYISKDNGETFTKTSKFGFIPPHKVISVNNKLVGFTVDYINLRNLTVVFNESNTTWEVIDQSPINTPYNDIEEKDGIAYISMYGRGLLSYDVENDILEEESDLFSETFVYSLVGNENVIWAGTYSGLYYSQDKGDTWESAGLQGLSVRQIVNNDEYLFLGTEFGVIRVPFATGVGELTGHPNYDVYSMAVNDKYVFAGTWNGFVGYPPHIMRSSDNGESWELVSNGIENMFLDSYYSLETFGDVVLAGTNDGFFRSTNNGDSWAQVNVSGSMDIIRDMYKDNDTLYVVTFNQGLFVSHDKGLTFEDISYNFDYNAFDKTINSIYAKDGLIMIATHSGAWQLDREKKEWFEITDNNIYHLDILVVDERILLGTRESVFFADFPGSSVYDNNPKNNDFLYPNPANEYVNFSLDIPVRYTVYNGLGNEVLSGIGNKKIDVSNLSDGVYIVKYEINGQYKTAKFIVNK